MNRELTERQRKWLETYCDGTIHPEEFRQFEMELESSAEFRALARSYLTMDANLSLGAESILDLSETWSPAQSAGPGMKAAYLWTFGAVGLVLFFTGLFIGEIKNQSASSASQLVLEEHDGIAILKHAIDAQWSGNRQPGENEMLSPGAYYLTEGSAEIEFYSGTRILLEAPVDLELISSNQAFCRRGKLRALVPPQARGFTIVSPNFELVDLGTEFGVSVSENGSSNVQVFDGEVELYPPDGTRDSSHLKRLTGGSGISFSKNGEVSEIPPVQGEFLSFQEHQEKTRAVVKERFADWQRWNQSVTGDEHALVHYDFQGRDSSLVDKSRGKHHGAIIGAQWTSGRFPGKQALEFMRPGDRVRLEIPGEFRELTFSAWVRMDSITGRTQSLFLTDNYKIGHPHWQVSPSGTLRFGLRLPPTDNMTNHINGAGFGSPEIFNARRLGIWTFVCTTFSLDTQTVIHYLNGLPVATNAEFVMGIPSEDGRVGSRSVTWEEGGPETLRIGTAEIGNWGAPYRPDVAQIAVRNFVGRIDSLTIWKKALDEKSIRQIYEATRL